VAVALPDDDERTAAAGRDGNPVLIATGRRMDLELAAEPRAVRAVSLGEHAIPRSIRAVAVEVAIFPNDDETALGGDGDVGRALKAEHGAVDAKRAAQRHAGAVVAAGEDVVVVVPHDDETVSIGRHGRRSFVGHRTIVDLELGTARRATARISASEDVTVVAALPIPLPDDDETAVRRHPQVGHCL
jgi:hypothetical protein